MISESWLCKFFHENALDAFGRREGKRKPVVNFEATVCGFPGFLDWGVCILTVESRVSVVSCLFGFRFCFEGVKSPRYGIRKNTYWTCAKFSRNVCLASLSSRSFYTSWRMVRDGWFLYKNCYLLELSCLKNTGTSLTGIFKHIRRITRHFKVFLFSDFGGLYTEAS